MYKFLRPARNLAGLFLRYNFSIAFWNDGRFAYTTRKLSIYAFHSAA